jgi:hypothetical protein
MSEINKNLDRESLLIFKDALKNYKTGLITDIDVFSNEVILLEIFIFV